MLEIAGMARNYFFFTSTDYKLLEMAGMAGNGRNGWKFLEMFKCKSTEMLSCWNDDNKK